MRAGISVMVFFIDMNVEIGARSEYLLPAGVCDFGTIDVQRLQRAHVRE